MLKIFALWALLIPASAQVYKWADDQGRTHYGEHPPTGRKAQEVEQRLANPAPAAGKPDQPNWKEKDLQFRGRRIQAEQAETKQEQEQAAALRACNQARDHLAQLKAARRSYRLDENGGRVYQSDEERLAAVAQAEGLVVQHCR